MESKYRLDLVRETKLMIVIRFFMDLGDYTTALEYLVMSKNYETAFEVARQNGQIQLFADILGDQASQEDLIKIALHYEQERNFLQAGKYYALAGQSDKVMINAYKFFNLLSSCI